MLNLTEFECSIIASLTWGMMCLGGHSSSTTLQRLMSWLSGVCSSSLREGLTLVAMVVAGTVDHIRLCKPQLFRVNAQWIYQYKHSVTYSFCCINTEALEVCSSHCPKSKVILPIACFAWKTVKNAKIFYIFLLYKCLKATLCSFEQKSGTISHWTILLLKWFKTLLLRSIH